MLQLLAQNQIQNPAVPAFGTGDANVAFTNLIVTVWRTGITLGGLALLLMIVLGALEWILAGGDKGKIEAGRARITQAIIGMLVLIGTVAISAFVGNIVGIDLLNLQFADNLDDVGGATSPNLGGDPFNNIGPGGPLNNSPDRR